MQLNMKTSFRQTLCMADSVGLHATSRIPATGVGVARCMQLLINAAGRLSVPVNTPQPLRLDHIG